MMDATFTYICRKRSIPIYNEFCGVIIMPNIKPISGLRNHAEAYTLFPKRQEAEERVNTEDGNI